jgi:hypothetical protein
MAGMGLSVLRGARSHPPKIGPKGRARKFAAAHMPIARGSSFSVKSTLVVDRAMTTMAAAATPSRVSGGDEDARGGGVGAGDRGSPEHDQGAQHHLLAAESVAENAGGQHRRSERYGVGGGEPLEVPTPRL